jgi:RecJ-like exonuclease
MGDVEMQDGNPGSGAKKMVAERRKKLELEWHLKTNPNLMMQGYVDASLFQSPACFTTTAGAGAGQAHVFFMMCQACNNTPAVVRCETCQKMCAPLAFQLCTTCDIKQHTNNPLHQRHGQVGGTWVPLLSTETVQSPEQGVARIPVYMQLNRTCPDCALLSIGAWNTCQQMHS